MEIVPYLPLSADILRQIVDSKLTRLMILLKQRFNAKIQLEDSVPNEILRQLLALKMVLVS